MDKHSLIFWYTLTEICLNTRHLVRQINKPNTSEKIYFYSLLKNPLPPKNVGSIEVMSSTFNLLHSVPARPPTRSYIPSSWAPCPLKACTTSWVGKQREQLCQNTKTNNHCFSKGAFRTSIEKVSLEWGHQDWTPSPTDLLTHTSLFLALLLPFDCHAQLHFK